MHRVLAIAPLALGLALLLAVFSSPAVEASPPHVPDGDLSLRPTHRHGADPLDPWATWFVSSYTAFGPSVPHVHLDGAPPGPGPATETADPLRRVAPPLVPML